MAWESHLSATPCVPRTPLCLGRDTSPWTAQHNHPPPSAAALQRMAGRFTRFWRGLANGTVPRVDQFTIITARPVFGALAGAFQRHGVGGF